MAFWRMVAIAQLLCVVGAAADGRKGLSDRSAVGAVTDQLLPAITSGSLLELTNSTLERRLKAVASRPERCIIFTTTSAWLPPLLNMTRNWFAHVHRCVARTPTHRRRICLPAVRASARKRPCIATVHGKRCSAGRTKRSPVQSLHAQCTFHPVLFVSLDSVPHDVVQGWPRR